MNTPARLAVFCVLIAASAFAADIGQFQHATDIGQIAHPGSSKYIADSNQYRVTGSGANIWGTDDAFQFMWNEVSGDVDFSADIAWEGEGKEPHRKACLMLRDGLEADAPYVDVAVHGDGLIELQYRVKKGGATTGIRTPIQAPATVRLERHANVFTASVAKARGAFQPIGAIAVPLPDKLHAGVAVSAHNAANSETAVVSNVKLKHSAIPASAKRVRESSLETVAIETGERRLVYRARAVFEAPNWTPDGRTLVINMNGRIYTLPVEGGEPRQVNTGEATACNNDHGLTADGKWLAISSGEGENGSKIYVLPATGGQPRLVTPLGPSYWHGWSPDGQTLIYTAKRNGDFDIYAIPAQGGDERRLTTAPGLDDGSEYTADGRKIYFNSERTGVMQLWRMNPDGSQQERVTNDHTYGDWFPHPSPDGKWLVFMSYDGAVKGHPADQNVTLRLMPLAGGESKVIATLFGGQGTINVPSWSPDSKHVAFVSYRYVAAAAPNAER